MFVFLGIAVEKHIGHDGPLEIAGHFTTKTFEAYKYISRQQHFPSRSGARYSCLQETPIQKLFRFLIETSSHHLRYTFS